MPNSRLGWFLFFACVGGLAVLYGCGLYWIWAVSDWTLLGQISASTGSVVVVSLALALAEDSVE